jgi:hypothetical protein
MRLQGATSQKTVIVIHKLWRYSMCNFLHPSIVSFPILTDISLSTMFSHTIVTCSSLRLTASITFAWKCIAFPLPFLSLWITPAVSLSVYDRPTQGLERMTSNNVCCRQCKTVAEPQSTFWVIMNISHNALSVHANLHCEQLYLITCRCAVAVGKIQPGSPCIYEYIYKCTSTEHHEWMEI